MEEGLQGLSPRSSVADEEENPSQQASAKGVAAPGHATHASHASLQNLVRFRRWCLRVPGGSRAGLARDGSAPT